MIIKPRHDAALLAVATARTVVFLVCVLAHPGSAQITVFEGDVFPETENWERILFCTPERELREGVFFQHVESAGECGKPPAGDQDTYFLDIDEFDGVETFFIEFHMEAQGDRSEIPWGAPAVFATGTLRAVAYWFAISRDQVKFVRDSFKEELFIDIEPGAAHTYRVELVGDQSYAVSIDGELITSGTPSGPFPAHSPRIGWEASAAFKDSTVKWDYVRFGVIPEDASGDFDSDEDVDLFDYYYVQECFSNSGPALDAGPGCRFADFDDDKDVDLKDLAALQSRYTGPKE